MLYLRTRILQWRIGNLSFFNTFIHFTTDMAEKTVCKIREAQSHPHIHHAAALYISADGAVDFFSNRQK